MSTIFSEKRNVVVNKKKIKKILMIRRYYIPSRNVYEEDVRINNVRALSVANTVMTKTPPNACSARKDSWGFKEYSPNTTFGMFIN